MAEMKGGMGLTRIVKSCQKIAELGGRGGAVASCRELLEMGRNEEGGGSFCELPLATSDWKN